MDPAAQVRSVGVAAFLLAAATLAVSQLPEVWAVRTDARGGIPGSVYAGYPYTYADEAATYLGWIRQAGEGRFFLTDRLTPEEHPRNYVNILWSAMAAVCALTGLSNVAVYSASRVLLGAVVLWMLWILAGRMFERPGARLACYTTLVVAGGWEGAGAFLERNAGGPHVSSPGWWTPQISTFFSLMLYPHILASFVCLLGAVLLMVRAWDGSPERGSLGFGIATGLVAAVLTFFHPMDGVTLLALVWSAPLAIGLVEGRIPWSEWRLSVWATAVWLPALLYNLYIFRTNPVMRAWDLQNLMISPEPWNLMVSYGVSGVLSAVALLRLRHLSRPQRIMAAWLIGVLVLIYLPLRFQRRMEGGIQFPLAVLATSTLVWIGDRVSRGTAARGGWAALGLTLLLLPLQAATPYYLLDIEMKHVRSGKFPSWLTEEKVAAFAYLERTSPSNAIVLASYDMGNLVPSRTGRRCFLGHYALTVDAKAKSKDVERFFAAPDTEDAWRRDFLQRWRITHLLYTPHERRLGSFEPSTRPWLRRVFHRGERPERACEVYEVLSAGTPGT